ncbi:hypothetical protein [Vogesella oryzae]|uniref:hypothetical protein n=1 Tax=Vogesella oryzae TaxID=1735285 RepID=UPI00158429B0|nr:hypothetical protein [Vogesella oryzae]
MDLQPFLDRITPFFWLAGFAGIIDIVVYQMALHHARLELGDEREARSQAWGTGKVAAAAVFILGALLLSYIL